MPAGYDRADAATFRRWVVATTVGELVAFSVPTGAWALASVAGLSDLQTLPVVILAGAGEGAVLGFAQSRALRRDVPALRVRRWCGLTAAAAALAWAIGMTPSTFHDQLASVPTPLLVVIGTAAGVALLCSIGAAQAIELRRHVEHAGRWVPANALGWLAGLPWVFIAMAVAPQQAAPRAVFAVAGGVAMGASVGGVTGAFLVRLLDHRRTVAPSSLGRRLRVHFNHMHARIYAESGGRMGAKMGSRPVLLLSTTGRRSGLPRRTPVQYESLDGALLLVAAAGGASRPPAWWLNLESDSRVSVQIGDQVRPATATTLGEEEHRRIWPWLCRRNHHLEGLSKRAGREIPIVRIVFADPDRQTPGSAAQHERSDSGRPAGSHPHR